MIRHWRKGRPITDQPSVLDIGCGRGHLLNAFKTCGASVLGLEREEFPDNGAANQFIEVGAIGDPQYHDRKFDIIVIWHVLEHMENHEQLLDEVTKHLSDKGILVVAVPNFGSLQQRLFSKHWFHLDLPRHLVHFESEWLERRLLERSYKIERKSHIDLLQNTFGFIQSTMNTITAHSQNDYYRILKHSRKRSTGSFIAMFGWSVFSIAVLPFALIDSALGAALGRGATVQFVARLEAGK
ncbi:MAG: class I SAM-dependent methyltransferase [Halioglobus sp.]